MITNVKTVLKTVAKAIVRVLSGRKEASHGSTCDLLAYCFKPRKDPSDGTSDRSVPDRVLWILGEFDGYGHVVKDASMMAKALECGHENVPGRLYRSLVLSSEKIPIEAGEERRAEAFNALRDSIPLLAREIGAKRWLGIAHDDRLHPHVHMVAANWDGGSVGQRISQCQGIKM